MTRSAASTACLTRFNVKEGAKTIRRQINARACITSLVELDTMIQYLQKLHGELKYAHSLELDVELGD